MENPGIFLMVFMKLCSNGWHDFCPPVFFAFFWTAFLSFLSSAQFWSGVEGASTGDLLDVFNFFDFSFMLVLPCKSPRLSSTLLADQWNDDLCKQSKFHNIDQIWHFDTRQNSIFMKPWFLAPQDSALLNWAFNSRFHLAEWGQDGNIVN